MLTTSKSTLSQANPFFGLVNPASSTNSKIIAPKTVPSNHCIFLILSYTCGRKEVKRQYDYNLLCRRAKHFLDKTYILNFFNLAPMKVIINQWTDPTTFFRSKVHQLSKLNILSLKINISLANIAKAIADDKTKVNEESSVSDREFLLSESGFSDDTYLLLEEEE